MEDSKKAKTKLKLKLKLKMKMKAKSNSKTSTRKIYRPITVSSIPAINAAINARRKTTMQTKKSSNSRKSSTARSISSSSKATPENDITCPRRKRGIIIPTVDLLSRAATGYKSNIKPLKPAELQSRINTMTFGPHYVNVTVQPATHTILVNITPEKIMISDWNGDIQTVGLKTINGKKNPDYEKKWEQYSDFIQLLQKKYDLPVQYYEIDDELKTKAEAKAEAGGGGGCAEYAYEWANKYKHLLEG